MRFNNDKLAFYGTPRGQDLNFFEDLRIILKVTDNYFKNQ